ncbi:hypothetical protein GGX14DRAFT_609454 [Mycena pura]|uniref:Uncharacterized protein n=1 Tax=Mycena pura TaxID=153505 RepID=A0AAD6YE81_9AGAR|nr:hypothetical protein GGX14DRAFT_609454 [Mycena pura]
MSVKLESGASTSTSHPLLKSSRGRARWPDQLPPTPSDKICTAPREAGPDPAPAGQTRLRTSSVTSVKTIRFGVSPKVAVALLKPKPLLGGPMIGRRSARKRTHSATSPGPDEDDLGAPWAGPRVRQRTDSRATAGVALANIAVQRNGTVESRMPTSATSALKKLRDKLTPGQSTGASDILNVDPRPSLCTKSSSSVDDICGEPQLVPFPSKHPTASPSEREPPTRAPPLQTLSPNTQSRRPPIRMPISGARLNKYGCYEPDISELELAVTFPTSSGPHFEVWDQEDELFLVGPLSLHLTVRNPEKWTGVPLSHPDVAILELTCTSKPVVTARPYGAAAATSEDNRYRVRHEPAAASTAKTRAPGPAGTVDAMAGSTGGAGIAVDPVWLRTYPDGGGRGRRGWAMGFAIPIATRLFDRCETRAFQVEARVAVWGAPLAAPPATITVHKAFSSLGTTEI